MPLNHIARIQENNQSYGIRAWATASILLDFYTDSTCFGFSFDEVKQASAREWYYFSLYINGKKYADIGEEKAALCEGKYYTDLPVGRKRITLFFPNLFRARLNAIELSENATVEAVEKQRKVLFIGDSITQGYDAKCAANSYVNRLAYINDWEVVNAGIGGARFEDYWIDENSSYEPDEIFVALGTNAWKWNTKEVFTQTCEKFFEKLSMVYSNKPIFVMLPIWREESYSQLFQGTFIEGRELLAKIVKQYPQIQIIDLWEHLPQDKKYYSDGVHPNEQGMEFLFKELSNALKK